MDSGGLKNGLVLPPDDPRAADYENIGFRGAKTAICPAKKGVLATLSLSIPTSYQRFLRKGCGQRARENDILTSSLAKIPTIHPFLCNGVIVVKLNVREKESIQEAVRRFRKLVERSGIKKEMRRREYYEKPSETRRRARLRAERRTRPRKII